jgi:ATP phosphoribosyltransferase regulatory subunit
LPTEAKCIESIRRKLLDLFYVHGYELVIPPLLEYVESLLTGTGHDMDLRIFKVVDQLSGRMMGVRADITPQAARIDAHLLNRKGITRLCYAGSVLHTLPASKLSETREPFQLGAELYGHGGIESDIEIQQLMIESLKLAGLNNIHIDIGHVGIFRSILEQTNITPQLENELFQALQNKDIPAITDLAGSFKKEARDALTLLPTLYGEIDVLEKAAAKLPATSQIKNALKDLKTVANQIKGQVKNVYIDLADLRGYHYHSGIAFSAYVDGWPNAVAQGGRYDEIGKAFGRSRQATGFSLDMRQLAEINPSTQASFAILAPSNPDPELQKKISELRKQNETVIINLLNHEEWIHELNCDRRLVFKDGKWQIVKIN